MLEQNEPILIVDDEADVLRAEQLALRMEGITNVVTCSKSHEVCDIVEEKGCGIIVLDLIMPGMGGEELQVELAERYPNVTVIMLTGVDNVQTAVACMKRGAFDYITKPIDPPRLVSAVRNALRHRAVISESNRLREGLLHDKLENFQAFEAIISRSKSIRNIFRYLEATAPTRLPILLYGETGVGKELFAKAIHEASGAEGQFVCVNCAGIDDQLFSDTLFGHTPDAFTGAGKERHGLIRQAVGGTLFLDEIGDLKSESQIKLLRLLQEGTYYKLGADIPDRSDTRIVAATNVDLRKGQADGTFRRDLFYRLQSHQVDIPPLRDRKEDIPLLLEHFLERAADEMNKRKPTAPPELPPLLRSYDFPGNIRELQGMVYDAVSQHTGGVLSCATFKTAIKKLRGTLETNEPLNSHVGELSFPDPLPTAREVEQALVAEALHRAEGNKTLAANMLGMTRKTLRNKIPDDSDG